MELHLQQRLYPFMPKPIPDQTGHRLDRKVETLERFVLEHAGKTEQAIGELTKSVKSLEAVAADNVRNVALLTASVGTITENVKAIEASNKETLDEFIRSREPKWNLFLSVAGFVLVAGSALWGLAIRPLANEQADTRNDIALITQKQNAIESRQGINVALLGEIETQLMNRAQIDFLRNHENRVVLQLLWREMKGYGLPEEAPYMYGPEWSKH